MKQEYESRMDAALLVIRMWNASHLPEQKRVAEHIYNFAEQLRRLSCQQD